MTSRGRQQSVQARRCRTSEFGRAREPCRQYRQRAESNVLVVLLLRVSGNAVVDRLGFVRNYFDYNATTPVPPGSRRRRVARALADTFGNASSVHGFGQQAKAALDEGPVASVADLIVRRRCRRWSSLRGSTAFDKFALRGAAEAQEATQPPPDCERQQHRTRGGPQHLSPSRAAWIHVHDSSRHDTGVVTPAALSEGDGRRRHSGLGDACEQRDWHGPADRGAGHDRACCTARSSTPTRCRLPARFP